MKNILIVGLGGFLGAITRYGVAAIFGQFWAHPFPLATFAINITGSFCLGFFLAYASQLANADPAWRMFVATGFLGAYTTFSTFEYETHELAGNGAYAWAVANVVLSVVAGFIAVRLGAYAAD